MPFSPFRAIEFVPRVELERLFDEETSLWSKDLSWSFTRTRRRLEDALDEGTLKGLVASDALGACAYATYAVDEDQGVVGSFFSAARSRARGIEEHLIHEILNLLLTLRPRVIDCQTLFSTDRGMVTPFANRGFHSAARLYMTIDRAAWRHARRAPSPGFRSRPTHRTDLRSVARLVYEAHVESRDLDASSSFDTPASCERILRQILLDEVCGPFDSAGSRRVEENGEALAVSLLTWPFPGVAHVSEVATSPGFRRRGLARNCLIESLASAFERGALTATLSVTASNQAARDLYESMGFSTRVQYESHVLRGAAS